MKRNILIILVIILCGTYIFVLGTNENKSTSNENKNIDIKKLVNDYSVGHLTAQSASITSDQLIVTEKDLKENTYSLPKDVFFVSIAPYIQDTHECAIHNLTGCRGELVNEEFDIYIEDSEGNIITNKKMKSLSNGFIDLWLPRNETYDVTIQYEGKKVESIISTFENDNTCITTMKLT